MWLSYLGYVSCINAAFGKRCTRDCQETAALRLFLVPWTHPLPSCEEQMAATKGSEEPQFMAAL